MLEVIREEAYYFVAAVADEDHERGLGHVLALEAHDREDPRCDRDHRLRRSRGGRPGDERRAGSIRTSSASSSIATSRSAGTAGQFGKEWEDCDDLDAKRNWNLRLGLGKKKIFEVRALYNDVTFIDEFLTPDFCRDHKLFSFALVEPERALRDRDARVQGGEGEAPLPADERRQPVHLRRGRELREPRASSCCGTTTRGSTSGRTTRKEVLRSLVRVWKRPVNVTTVAEGKPVMLRYDGKEQTTRHLRT